MLTGSEIRRKFLDFFVQKGHKKVHSSSLVPAVVSTAFGRSDGMLNAECNGGSQTAGAKTRDGKLWFPTQDGVAVIDPEAVPYNPLPPSVVIESGEVQGRPVRLNGGLRLKANEGSLDI